MDDKFNYYYVLLLNGVRWLRIGTNKKLSREKAYLWLEGYICGLNNPNITFDNYHKNTDQHLLLMVLF